MAGHDLTERKPHDEAEELLPWYANGQLDATDRAKVDAHLSSCAHCRQQLVLDRQLIDEFQAMTPEVESGWARLRNRVEVPATLPVRTFKPRRPSPLAEAFAFLSRPAIATLAAAQLAFIVIAGGTLGLTEPASLPYAELFDRARFGQRPRHVPRRCDRERHSRSIEDRFCLDR